MVGSLLVIEAASHSRVTFQLLTERIDVPLRLAATEDEHVAGDPHRRSDALHRHRPPISCERAREDSPDWSGRRGCYPEIP